MSTIDLSAHKKWMQISDFDRMRLLNNAFCTNCCVTAFAKGYSIEPSDEDIIITGKCKNCGAPIARLIEKEWWSK